MITIVYIRSFALHSLSNIYRKKGHGKMCILNRMLEAHCVTRIIIDPHEVRNLVHFEVDIFMVRCS